MFQTTNQQMLVFLDPSGISALFPWWFFNLNGPLDLAGTNNLAGSSTLNDDF